MMKLTLLVLISLAVALPSATEAATYTAVDCTSAQVQAALNKVSADGDVVVIPACAATAWTTTVSYTATVSFTIQGSTTVTGTCAPGGSCTAADNTIIVDNLSRGAGCGSPDNPALSITTGAAGKTFRMTGITFQFTGSQTCNGSILIGGNSQNIRLDHNHFSQQYSTGVHMTDYTFGVIDHNFFEAPSGVWNAIKFEESRWGGDTLGVGDAAWAAPTAFGSNQFVFVENNEFHSSFPGSTSYANDCTSGGRYVWRYNLEVNVMHQTHPTGGGARHRGCRATEIYKNTVTGTGGTGANFNFFFLSSGTSLIWGNSADSTYSNFVTLHSMRRNSNTYGQSNTPNGWGYCGTSFNGTGSAWDQNSNTTTGYACLDQPGRGVGQRLINDFPNTQLQSTGKIAWPQEALEPVYEWLNTFSGSTFVSVYETDALFANADYYLHASSFTGASGTGNGTLAARPSTCTPSVAYWATDTSTLYQCSAANTWTAYYTPYTYPHPLTGNAAPVPPTGLQIK